MAEFVSRMDADDAAFVDARIMEAAAEPDEGYTAGPPAPRGVESGAPPTGLQGVSQDATSGKYVPASAAEWAIAAAAAGVSSPYELWLSQQASGNLTGSINAVGLTASVTSGTVLYQQNVTGWTRKAATISDGAIASFASNGGLGFDPSTTSTLSLWLLERTGTPAADRLLVSQGGQVYARILSALIDTNNHIGIGVNAAITNAGTIDYGSGTLIPVVLKHDIANSQQKLYTHQEVLTKAYAAFGTAEAGLYFVGTVGGTGGGPAGYAYGAFWKGASAEMTDAQVRALLTTLGWSVSW